jgi:hypothetical protein
MVSADITGAEAVAVYECLLPEMTAAYGRSGVPEAATYAAQSWKLANTAPYLSVTHGGRHVNNWVNREGWDQYLRFEGIGTAEAGMAVALDSFVIRPDGQAEIGPLFMMRKMEAGFNADTGDWKYTMILPDGTVSAETTSASPSGTRVCVDCHSAAADQDQLMFMPEEYRRTE